MGAGPYRVVARCTELEDFPLVFDVVLDTEKKIKNVPVFGVNGKIDRKFYPFVLQKTGLIDYGSDYEDPSTCERPCNLRTKTVDLGAQSTFEEWDEDANRYRQYVYAITQLQPLNS